MNAFESNVLDDWWACRKLLILTELDEFNRRFIALIAAMELCENRTWLVGDC